MSKPPVNPRAVGIGFGIVLAFICMGFLVLFCCCCSRKRWVVVESCLALFIKTAGALLVIKKSLPPFV